MNLTNNAMATVLLCSRLNSGAQNFVPYSTKEWNLLAEKVLASPIEEPGNLLEMEKHALSATLDLNEEEISRIYGLLSRGANIAFSLDDLEKKSIYITTRSDSNYPRRLRRTLGKNAPPLLYYCGDLALCEKKTIAVVGSRNIDSEGEDFTRQLAQKAVDEGYALCSGGAKGVDQISENAALQQSGYCISFVADSMSRKIKQKNIRDAILSKNMVLISAVNPDAPFHAANAMSRNKYVYSMSEAAFVIASDYKKGGTWAGASENIKSGKTHTYIWDNPRYQGNAFLIQMGGKAFTDLERLAISSLAKDTPKFPQQLDFFAINNSEIERSVADSSCDKKQDIKTVVTASHKDIEIATGNQPTHKSAIYMAILPILLGCLDAPKSLDEIVKELDITKKQAQIWIAYAIQEKMISKTASPVKYLRAQL